MDYGYEAEAKMQAMSRAENGSILGGVGANLNRAIEVKAIDRCISDAGAIREQVAHAAKMADGLLERLAGPRPEECSSESGSKDVPSGGAIGEISRVQSSTVSYLADLRRTLEQIGKYV